MKFIAIRVKTRVKITTLDLYISVKRIHIMLKNALITIQ